MTPLETVTSLGLPLMVALLAREGPATKPAPSIDGLEATVSLAQRPEPSARELVFDFGLKNVGPKPVHLNAWAGDAWRVEIRGDETLGCADPVTERVTGPLELAPGAAHVWRARCRVVTLPQHNPVRLPAGGLTARALYRNHAQPSWLLTQDRTHYWTGEVPSAPIAFETPAAPGELEPPLDPLPAELRLGDCRARVEVLRFYRYVVPPPRDLGGMVRPPPKPLDPGEKPKVQLADVLTLVVHARNEGGSPCELRHWQIFAHGPGGERIALRPLYGLEPAGWVLAVAPGKQVDAQLGVSLGVSTLVPRETYLLTFSLEETERGRGWLSLGRVRFSPPEENPVVPQPPRRDPGKP